MPEAVEPGYGRSLLEALEDLAQLDREATLYLAEFFRAGSEFLREEAR